MKNKENKANILKVKVLGVGCPNCQKLEININKALEDLGWDVVVEKITKMEEIAEYGVMSLPALVVNERVLSNGKILSVDEVKSLLGIKPDLSCSSEGVCKECCC